MSILLGALLGGATSCGGGQAGPAVAPGVGAARPCPNGKLVGAAVDVQVVAASPEEARTTVVSAVRLPADGWTALPERDGTVEFERDDARIAVRRVRSGDGSGPDGWTVTGVSLCGLRPG